jgi:hypothetical protein
MRELLQQKLTNLSDLNERLVLKNIMEQVFLDLYDHSEALFKTLEQRVFDEIEYIGQNYTVYTGLVSKTEYNPIHDFLYPMIEEDLEEKKYDLEKLLDALLQKNTYSLFKVFLRCDYKKISELLVGKKKFKGIVKTAQKTYEAHFELQKEDSYQKRVECLYETFIQNKIPWQTLYTPYIQKILKVVLVECEKGLTPEDTIEEIVVDFGEYSSFVEKDMIPLWNIQRLQLKTVGFSIPCENKLHFEHKVSLVEEGVQHGYLVDTAKGKVKYIRHLKESLGVTATQEESEMWDIWKIIRPEKTIKNKEVYRVVSNARQENFIEKLSQKIDYPIKTKGEILRLMQSLDVAKGVHLREIEIIDRGEKQHFETYPLNEFIIDEIRDEAYTKVMLLSFEVENINDFLINDLISFIVAEIQRYYPEYQCEGRVL